MDTFVNLGFGNMSSPYWPSLAWAALRYVLAALLAVVTIATACTISSIAIQAARVAKAPRDLQWVGLNGKRFLPRLRAALREFTAGRDPIREAYEKVCSTLPSVLSGS